MTSRSSRAQARLELMENKDKLATQRSQLLETKVEKITKEKETGRKTGVVWCYFYLSS